MKLSGLNTGHHDPCFLLLFKYTNLTLAVTLSAMKIKKIMKNSSQAFEVMWRRIGNEVVDSVGHGRCVFLPHRGAWRDFCQTSSARRAAKEELELLRHEILVSIDFDEGADILVHLPNTLMRQSRLSCEILGIDGRHAQDMAIAAILSAREWQESSR